MRTMTSASVTSPRPATRGNVHVTRRRVVATMVDGFVIGGIYAAMAAMFGTITTDTGVRHWVATMPAAGTVAYAVVVALYFVLLEGYRGQTLGKMVAGITVVGEATGAPPGLAAATVRTALRRWTASPTTSSRSSRCSPPPSDSAWATWRHTPLSSAPDRATCAEDARGHHAVPHRPDEIVRERSCRGT